MKTDLLLKQPIKILFLTNLYPPKSTGGYELWCQEVAEGLKAKGHEVIVLTSRVRQKKLIDTDPAWVIRDFYPEMEDIPLLNSLSFFLNRKAHEVKNLELLRSTILNFFPDIILIWGMWNLPRSLPALAERLKDGEVVYYLGDYWPTLPSQHIFYWNAKSNNRVNSVLKSLFRKIALRILEREKQVNLKFPHVLFPSSYVYNEYCRKGFFFDYSKIIYGAIDTSLYATWQNPTPKTNDFISLLYVGRLAREKGVHVALQAVNILVHEYGLKNIRLNIIGSAAGSGEFGYEEELHALASKFKIEAHISFLGSQPGEALPEYYRNADIFLFTSTWPEPFGRVVVEAMASGVAVIGSRVGGTSEIFIENVNALTYPPGDAECLAQQIIRLVHDPALRQRLAENGRCTALDKFDIRRMVSEIEETLEDIIHQERYQAFSQN